MESVHNLLHIITIHLQNNPVEGFHFGFERAEGHHIIGRAVNLFFIVVDDGNQVIHLFAASEHKGFPDLTFFEFAVAGKHENGMGVLVLFFSDGGTDGHGDTLSE